MWSKSKYLIIVVYLIAIICSIIRNDWSISFIPTLGLILALTDD